ncbi:MAG: RecQ family ATP-dependent DNA helicase [Bacteroidia bacterium]
MSKQIQQILTRYWGHSSFRPMQEEIIESVLAGNDTLALLPTGGGKSICFQVPAMASDGICIVISPLIALMKDQVQNLKARGIPAVAVVSGMKKSEVDIALDNCVYGKEKFLYVSPERLTSDIFIERLKLMKVNLLAIDEAHCISQWGYDFRPSYLKMSERRQYIPNVPILALTATATKNVVTDIQQKLLFKKENVFRKSFERKNLAYIVLYEEDKLSRLLKVVRNVKGSGVVYVRTRKRTAEIAEF